VDDKQYEALRVNAEETMKRLKAVDVSPNG